MVVELARELLEILACPNCHGALAVDHDRDELVCVAADCGLAYPVRQGIPVLLIDEARRPGGRVENGPGGRVENGPGGRGENGPGGRVENGPAAPGSPSAEPAPG